jgi:hypothetical protein
VKEIFNLSGNFKEYLYSFAKHPIETIVASAKGGLVEHPDLQECTFKPAIDSKSVRLDQK